VGDRCERVIRDKCALYAGMEREFWGITEISCMSIVNTFCKV
jgi:hypothetical protein